MCQWVEIQDRLVNLNQIKSATVWPGGLLVLISWYDRMEFMLGSDQAATAAYRQIVALTGAVKVPTTNPYGKVEPS
jgi:hypothetical protein